MRSVHVADARSLAEPPTLDTHGFTLLHSPTRTSCEIHDAVQLSTYLEETVRLVQEETGAEVVVPFHHLKMDTAADKFGKRSGAVERVHGDYTHTSGPLMLQELRQRGVVPAETADMRGAIINVWRNASHEEVQSKPLAVCDIQSVEPEHLGTYSLVEGGDELARRRMGQNLSMYYSPLHRWYFYPRMRRDEALIFFTYDGRKPNEPQFTLHAAFDAANTPPDAPARVCVIVRLACFFSR